MRIEEGDDAHAGLNIPQLPRDAGRASRPRPTSRMERGLRGGDPVSARSDETAGGLGEVLMQL
jgi:hypothetical protein